MLGWITRGASPRMSSNTHAKWRICTQSGAGSSPEPSYGSNNGWVENPEGQGWTPEGHGVGKAPGRRKNLHRVWLAWGDKAPLPLMCLLPALIQRMKLPPLGIWECCKGRTIFTIASPGRYLLVQWEHKEAKSKDSILEQAVWMAFPAPVWVLRDLCSSICRS